MSEDAISVSENSEFEVVQDGVSFSIASRTEGDFFELASFVPMFRLDGKCFGGVAGTEEISFVLRNDTDVSLTVSVCLTAGNRRSEITKIVVPAMSESEYTVQGISSTGWSETASADGIAFVFENLDENSQPYPVRKLTLRELYFTRS